MTAVTTIKPHLSSLECPDLLRGLPAWVVWRFEQFPGEEKPRKVPYYVSGAKRHGKQGRPEDRQQLATFDAARTAAARRGFDGVGFCLLPDWGVVALDFDNCVTPVGLHPDVERLVAGTYAEWSPSGQGVRAFMRGALVNRKDASAASKQQYGYGFETFSSNGFVTLTGNRLEITEITDAANTLLDVTPEVVALCAQRFGRSEPAPVNTSDSTVAPIGLSHQQLQDALDVLDPSIGHDEWLRVGMALHHETNGERFDLWDDWSAGGSQYPGSEALQARWDSFGRGGQRPTTAHALVNMANEQGARIELAQLSADDFSVIPVEPPAPAKPLKFRLWSVQELVERKPPGWIIKDVAPQAELMVIFGESGAGKSFVVLDMFAAVARGAPWLGNRTRRGKVVYVVAEGRASFGSRVKAYCEAYGVLASELDDLTVIADTPNLLQKDDAAEIVRSMVAAGGASVIVIDTFAQVTPGANENAAEDVGKALANCKAIHRATGALIVLVHHAGKDQSRGARGWSGLKAAADAEVEISRGVAGRAIRVSKQKDGMDGIAWGFQLDVVPVGADEDGDVITSCVMREAALPVVQQVGSLMRDLGPAGRLVVAVVNEIALAQTAGIEVAAVVAEVAKRLPEPEGSERDTRKQRAKQALNTLCKREDSPYFIEDDGTLTIV